MENKITKITWRDSRRYVYQMEDNEDFSVCEITTVGFLVKEETKHFVLAQDLIDDEFRGIIVIPKENVIKIIKFPEYPKFKVSK